MNEYVKIDGTITGYDSSKIKVKSNGRKYVLERKFIPEVYKIKVGERVRAQIRLENSRLWQSLKNLPPPEASFRDKVLRSYSKVFQNMSKSKDR